jgi:hypothetical protein
MQISITKYEENLKKENFMKRVSIEAKKKLKLA